MFKSLRMGYFHEQIAGMTQCSDETLFNIAEF